MDHYARIVHGRFGQVSQKTGIEPILEMTKMLTQISNGLLLVDGANGGKFPYSHSVIIEPKKNRAVLLDTGCGIDVLKELKSKFNFEYIINSHTHLDHSAGNWLFRGEDAREIYAPQESFDSAGNMVVLSERLAEPGPLAEYWKEYVVKAMGFKDCRPTKSYNSQSAFDLRNIASADLYPWPYH